VPRSVSSAWSNSRSLATAGPSGAHFRQGGMLRRRGNMNLAPIRFGQFEKCIELGERRRIVLGIFHAFR
jgi:hypothetical protein